VTKRGCWKWRSSLVASFCFVSTVAAAEEPMPPARAGAEEQLSPARALFAEGRKLAADGNYAAACPKFEESLRLEVGVGTQFNLANCWEHTGRIASAQALFLGAAASAKAVGQADREQVLRERAAALEPRLTRLVIEVGDSDPKLVVKRDDLPLARDTLGTALAIDPGTYVIVAKAPGKKTWTKKVAVTAQAKVVTVEIPVLESAEQAAPAAPKQAARAEPRQRAAEQTATDPVSDRARTPLPYKAIAVAGAGVASLALGTVFAVRFKKANDDAKEICPSNRNCTVKQIQEHDRLVDKARGSRPWIYAGYGVGVAALGGAAVLYLFDRRTSTSAAARAHTTLQALPAFGQHGELGASVSGAF
jgi:hypothetical protein